MTENLDLVGYEQTKEKLAALEQRMLSLVARKDLRSAHLEEAKRSYETMIAQYSRELKLYEAAHPEVVASN